MLPTNGLYGHIRNNTLKSAMLMAGFVGLLAAYWFAISLGWVSLRGLFAGDFRMLGFGQAWDALWHSAVANAIDTWYVPVGAAGLWFAIAWRWHGAMISAGTGAREVTRRDEPKLYNAVETLAIGAGLPMPRVEIMETRGLNAYAAGLSPASATVAVTRGLLDTLEPDELRAVLAHEMTHIKNRDVQLMVVALIFAGGLTFLGNSLRSVTSFGRGPNGDNLMVPRHIFDSSEPDGEDIKELSAGALAVLVGITVAVATLALTHVFALLTQFAVSRAREFLADAGAVELTKDPDALISALQKVAGHDFVPVIAENFRAMMISNQFDEDNFMDKLFATHPSLGDRITSLQQYAGGRIVAKRRRAARGGFGPAQPANGGAGNAAAFAGGRASFGRRRAIGA